MTSFLRACAVWGILLTLCAPTIALGDADETEPYTVESATPSAALGFDVYGGTSDMVDNHRLTDGMWAGNGTFYPSIVYVQWSSASGTSGRVSLGIGDLYTDPESVLEQPVEAFLEMPVGSATVTVGKFWVPFAQQEWLYESKPGVMAAWQSKRLSLTAAAAYDVDFHRPKLYARIGCAIAEDAEIGLSYARGTGFCSDSIHDRGLAVDTTLGWAGFRFYGEYDYFDADVAGRTFNYISGKLYYENLGKFTPFIGRFAWTDCSDAFDDFRSTVYGINYQASSTTALEGAIADTGDETVAWLQFHWNWEKPFKPLW